MSAAAYHELGEEMFEAARQGGAQTDFFADYPLDKCWLFPFLIDKVGTLPPPATETPSDRYETLADHTMSNIVQHSRTQWALESVARNPNVAETIVWLDLGILKQGKWNGKPIEAHHVTEFVEKVQAWDYAGGIPFPGIEDRKPVLPHGNNWRYCGSTHIWPVTELPIIDAHYKFWCKEFIRQHKCVPLDLAVWPEVEAHSGLPFRWYKADYDHTQLSEFPSC